MKQATFKYSWILAVLSAMLWAGCGNQQATFNQGSGNQPLKPVTDLKHRCLVTNYYGGTLQVVDTVKKELTHYTFSVGTAPTYMQLSSDGFLTLVNNTGSNTLTSFNNYLEAVKATIQLGGWTQSFVTSVDNKKGYAAVYNHSNGSTQAAGAIVRFNPTDGSLDNPIPFPNVLNLAMDPSENHLLAFTDADNDAHWVDLQATDPATLVPPYYTLSLSDGGGNPVTLSRPVAAFFSSDGTKAYVLSCGSECGGSSGASVTEIDTTSITTPLSMTTGTVVAATVLNQWAVSGARIGLLDTSANRLYVAGSTQFVTDSGGFNVQDGYLTVITLSAIPAFESASAPIRIGNGVKRWIRDINGTLWVASLNCGAESCVTMVHPTAGTAQVLADARGDATGLTLASNDGNNKDNVYTIEGGDLYIYDQTGAPVTSDFTTDIIGQGSDVLYIN